LPKHLRHSLKNLQLRSSCLLLKHQRHAAEEAPAAEEPQPVAEASEAPAEEPAARGSLLPQHLRHPLKSLPLLLQKRAAKKSSIPVSAENTGDADFDWDEFAADELEGTENKS
jgi:hypothetical protein